MEYGTLKHSRATRRGLFIELFDYSLDFGTFMYQGTPVFFIVCFISPWQRKDNVNISMLAMNFNCLSSKASTENLLWWGSGATLHLGTSKHARRVLNRTHSVIMKHARSRRIMTSRTGVANSSTVKASSKAFITKLPDI